MNIVTIGLGGNRNHCDFCLSMDGRSGPVGSLPLPPYHSGCGCGAHVEKDFDPELPLEKPRIPKRRVYLPDEGADPYEWLYFPPPPNMVGSPDDRDERRRNWSGGDYIPAGGGGSSGFGSDDERWSGGGDVPGLGGGSGSSGFGGDDDRRNDGHVDWTGNDDLSPGGGGSSGFGSDEPSNDEPCGGGGGGSAYFSVM